MSSSIQIWNKFCDRHEIAVKSVPLFEHGDDLTVGTKQIGRKNSRFVLRRSSSMDALLIGETAKIVSDWNQQAGQYDGLIYMMHAKTEDQPVVPLYIGKAEKHGKGDRNLSANLINLSGDLSKFARWGENYAYHIGDLSAVMLEGHPAAKRTLKYTSWADALFVEHPSQHPRLKQPVNFWAKAWSPSDIGIWENFHPTRLAFLEYLMIGVAAQAFPARLLNREGFGR